MLFSIIFALACIIFLTVYFVLYVQQENEKKSAQAQALKQRQLEDQQKEEERQKRIRKAKRLYDAVNNMNKSISEMDENEIDIIKNSFGISTVDELNSFYILGETTLNKEKAYEIAELREKELKENEKNICLASISGKEKYLSIVLDALDEEKKIINDDKLEDNLKYANNMINYKAKTSNEYWWAGLAGGGLAGALVASDIRSRNSAAKESEARIRQDGRDYLRYTQYEHQLHLKIVEECGRLLEDYDNLLFDDSNINEKFNNLIFSEVNLELLPSGNIKANFDIDLKDTPKIFDKDAILDGTIKLTIKNKENQVIAIGYYLAPEFGDWGLIHSGFNGDLCYNRHKRIDDSRYLICSATCIVQDYNKKINIEDLICEFEPVSIWLIENVGTMKDDWGNERSKFEARYKILLKNYILRNRTIYEKNKGEELWRIWEQKKLQKDGM